MYFFSKLAVIILWLILFTSPAYAKRNNMFRATCIQYSELYSKVINNSEKASYEDIADFSTLAGLAVGYISALQNLSGLTLIHKNRTEMTLLTELCNFCMANPAIPYEDAVRTVTDTSGVVKTIKSLEKNKYQQQQTQKK
ncbi:MAG: hypothetical protein KAJ75_05360 [Alphaproteobacteria bacterium]|nr:hypothetical protein [Alphaproteobacteria bacterium]